MMLQMEVTGLNLDGLCR